MNEQNRHYQNRLGRSITLLLKPLVRLLIRSGVGFSDFAEWAKFAFVKIAEKEFLIDGKQQSTSRISILTGLHRKEVARIRSELSDKAEPEEASSANRAARVINAWLREPRYTGKQGLPLVLPLDSNKSESPSFEMLVKEFSGDIHSTTLLDELQRIGAVDKLPDGRIELKCHGYIPTPQTPEQLDIMAQSAHDLLCTLDNNLNPETNQEKRFQRTVAYRHLSKQDLEAFKQFSEKENEKLLLKLNKWLAERDMSTAEQEKATCQYRTGVGIYYFEEPSAPSNED
jgi:hypothetical protein